MLGFGTKMTLFTIIFIGVLLVGFNGISSQVDVKYDTCEVHYRNYQLKPFLAPLVCLLTKLEPCGDFAEHRMQMAHIAMYDCLCRDPSRNAGDLRQYILERDPDSGLPNDVNGICQRRPRFHQM